MNDLQLTGTAITSDVTILDLLRKTGAMSVSGLALATGVTATAVRQRLNRLIGQRLTERVVVRSGRGRPSHRYSLTDKGRRQTGSNFADLALALWSEIREIKDPTVRRGLLVRLAKRLSTMYGGRLHGSTLNQQLESLTELFGDRQVPFSVGGTHQLPVLTADACPYPELAEHDRSICAMEKILFSEMLGRDVKLTQCRLDGANCCTFEMN